MTLNSPPGSPSHDASAGGLPWPGAPGSPLYLVSPRYLAGDDGLLGERVAGTLRAAGWTCWTTRRQAVHLYDRDQLRIAEWSPQDPDFLLDDHPVGWRFAARTGRHEPPLWHAYFTTGTPHELVAGFATALARLPEATPGPLSVGSVLGPLAEAGWSTDPTDPGGAYHAPRLQAWVRHQPLGDLLEAGDPATGRHGHAAWAQATATTPYQWSAVFSPSTPSQLIEAFCTALADPAPVPRTTLPDGTDGHLHLTFPTP